MDDRVKQYRSPLKKLVVFFQKSRDGWKAKTIRLRQELKLAKNQVRAVEKSRGQWRQKAEQAEAKARAAEAELEAYRAGQKKRISGPS